MSVISNDTASKSFVKPIALFSFAFVLDVANFIHYFKYLYAFLYFYGISLSNNHSFGFELLWTSSAQHKKKLPKPFERYPIPAQAALLAEQILRLISRYFLSFNFILIYTIRTS